MTQPAPHNAAAMQPADFASRIPALYNQVYMTAVALARNPDTAQDITQETFLRACLHLHTLRDPEQLVPWLHRIARNLALQWQRDGRNRSRLVPLIPLEEAPVHPADTDRPSPRESAAQTETHRQLMDAVMALPEDMRQAVLLHFCEGMTASDIARTNGEAVSTVTRRLDKCRELLRHHMEQGLAAGLACLKPDARQAQRTLALVLAAGGLSASIKAQALALAADTPLATAAAATTTSGAISGSATVASILTKGILMKTAMTGTTVKLITATAIVAGGIFAARTLMQEPGRADNSPAKIPRTEATPASRLSTTDIRSAAKPTGSGSYASASTVKPTTTGTATRPDPEKRLAALKDDLVSTNPQLVIADGETSGRIHFDIMVVNESGLPVEGATVEMTGQRTQVRTPTWYSWRGPKISAVTNNDGIARVSGPQFVEENLFLGGVTFNVSHPDYASTNEDMRLDTMKKVVLKSGEMFEVIVSDAESSTPLRKGINLHFRSRFKPDWSQRGDGTISVRKINDKELSFYATYKEDGKTMAFSPVEKIIFPRDTRTPIHLTVYPGRTVHGRLSDNVTRPVKNGKVEAVTASGENNCGLYSEQTVNIKEDGTFELIGMPRGEILIWALADGWCSEVGTHKMYNQLPDGKATLGVPQTFTLTEPEQEYVLPMIPTATAILNLTDPEGRPVAGAMVASNPNMCREGCCGMWIRQSFSTTSTVEGIAVIPDLPPLANTRFAVYGDYELPPRDRGADYGLDRFERELLYTLSPGQVLEESITVYPKGSIIVTQDGDKMTTAPSRQ